MEFYQMNTPVTCNGSVTGPLFCQVSSENDQRFLQILRSLFSRVDGMRDTDLDESVAAQVYGIDVPSMTNAETQMSKEFPNVERRNRLFTR